MSLRCLSALAVLALVPLLGLVALATAEGGIKGQVSKGWDQLTDPNAQTPANTPDRLTATSSVRARYWREAFKVHADSPWIGVGAGGYATARFRFRKDTLNVRHAHGYVVQTLADFGLAGAAVSLALLAAFLAAAGRTVALRAGSRLAYTPERIGLLTLLAIVVTFGVHSLVDWTWFVPGNVVPALLCAGWLAGRGPLVARPPRPTAAMAEEQPTMVDARPRPARSQALPVFGIAGAVAVAALATAAAWTTWQPERAVNATDDALAAVEVNRFADARTFARDARDDDPLSLNPLFTSAAVEEAAGNITGARQLHEEAVRDAPSSPEPWLQLAQFELDQNNARAALKALGPALYLDPRSTTVQRVYLLASRAETQRRADVAARSKQRSNGKNP